MRGGVDRIRRKLRGRVDRIRQFLRDPVPPTKRFLRRLPGVTVRVACFSIPALLIAIGIAVPVLLAVAAGAIAWINEPGTVADTEFIPDLSWAGHWAMFFGLLGFVPFWVAGSRRRIKAGLVAAPVLVISVLGLVGLLALAILVQGWIGTDDVQTRFGATAWILLIGLVTSTVLVWPVVLALRKWGGVEVVHPWMSVFVWAALAWGLLGNVGEEPDTPEAAAAKALRKEEATRRGSPPPRQAADLALAHSPVLHFDSGERRFPLDAEQFLKERGTDGGPAHQVCSDTAFGYNCDGVADARDLEARAGDPDAVIALDVNPAKSPRTEPRIYYHVDADDPDGRVHIDYWIFYRYNDSPKFSDHTCLSGLSIKDLTCFDHEGDWEGITVSLTRERQPESVVYVGHHWRHRFTWEDLEQLGVIRDGRPRVWVARGSHASYPAPCDNKVRQNGRLAEVSCRQPDSDVPDGDRDGSRTWTCETRRCVRPLPLTASGKPARWAAFAGYWGAARCTVGTRLCLRSRGPETPPFQGRYADPGGKRPVRELLRQWYGDAVDEL